MTAWYVRPDTSHNTTRNGQSHDTAWGGWSEVLWGASGVKANDILYICGVHTLSNYIAVGSHGATVGARTVISGGYGPNPGTIAFTPGGFFFLIAKDHTTLEDISIHAGTSHCVYLYPTAALTGVTVQSCDLNGGTGAAILGIAAANGQSYVDLSVLDNDFTGGTGAPLGGAISWTVAASGLPVSSLNRVTIHENRFTGCDADRAVIQLRMESGGSLSSKMADIVITDNVFRDCPTLGMEIVGPSLVGNPSYYGINTGIRITGNKFYDMTETDAAFNLGGAMGVGGFGPSLTPGFGENVIARNEGYRLTGPSGLLNLFYGAYQVYDNYGEDIVASQGDGNGLLVDHGCDTVVAYRNHFRRVIGNPATENSGCGIMILDAANITAYGNIVDGCKVGVYLGNKASVAQSSNIFGNNFLDCSYAGVLTLATADMATNLLRSNIFTGSASVPSVLVKSGTMTGESGNCYHGFGAASGHTLHASSVAVDPQLDDLYRTPVTSLHAGGTYLGGADFYGSSFPSPPPVGAVIRRAAKPIAVRSVTSRSVTARSVSFRRNISG